jgi:hypothetical protein
VGRGSQKAQRFTNSKPQKRRPINPPGLIKRRAVAHDAPRLGALHDLAIGLTRKTAICFASAAQTFGSLAPPKDAALPCDSPHRPIAASPIRRLAPPPPIPLTLASSSIYNISADPYTDRRSRKVMHPPVMIIVVLLCAPFLLRRTEFKPRYIVSRSFNPAPFRKKK